MFLIFQNDLAEKRKAETEIHREESVQYAIVDRKLLHKPPPRIIKVNGKMYQVSTDATPPQTPPSDLQQMRQQQLHSGELMPPPAAFKQSTRAASNSATAW